MGNYDSEDFNSGNEAQNIDSSFDTLDSSTQPLNEMLQSSQPAEDLCSKLIPMYNSLVDAFNVVDVRNEEFNLPEIVVVGSQSVGKSSVLESLVSRQFLPRGAGLVTRCPIELRLYKTESCKDGKEWVEFGHDETHKKWPFNKVANEITEQTIRLAGSNKGIVETPITVSVYSPNVIPLTIVDLPGLVKNRTSDQPIDIEDQIKKLIHKYISKPSTIILAISAANNDIANSESLKLARRVDESGERTLGVVTKIDKAERNGDELKQLLSGEIINLHYGFIGVQNYTPDDFKQRRTMDMVRDAEERLLNEIVPNLASQNGTKYLANKLSQLLVRNICKRLPGLENKIAQQLKLYCESIDALGSDDIPNKSYTMSTTIHRFCTKFTGEFEGHSRKINTTYVSGGAKAKFIFLNQLEAALATVDPLVDITNEEISNAILSSTAMESNVSVPEAAYHHLVKTQITKLLSPCLDCVRDVHKALQSTIEDCLDTEVTFRFPRLTEHLVGSVHKFLSDRLAIVIEILKTHIEIESAFTSTSRKDFRTNFVKLMAEKNITNASFAQSTLLNTVNNSAGRHISSDVIEKPETKGIETEVALETLEYLDADDTIEIDKKNDPTNMDDSKIVRSLIEAYFEIVRQSIRDYVPKLLTHSMIYYACDNLQVYLIEQLHSPEKIDDLVRVSDEASKQRTYARRKLEQLKKGEEIVKQIRDFKF